MTPKDLPRRFGYAEWLSLNVMMARHDPRKMFDKFGNPLEIPELGDNEAMALSGFEFVENFIGKKDEEKIAVGVTKKFKIIDRTKPLEIIGKAQGWYRDEDEDATRVPKSLKVVFVSPTGHQNVQVNVGTKRTPKVNFVDGRGEPLPE